MVKPVGTPRLAGSVESENCVLAMHTGRSPKPEEVIAAI